MAAAAWQGSGEGLPVCRPPTWTLQWWRASQQPSGCSDEGANPFRMLRPHDLIAAAPKARLLTPPGPAGGLFRALRWRCRIPS